MSVYTMQTVVQPAVKPVVQPAVQLVVQPAVKPVVQPAASCIQTFSQLYNRLYSRLYEFNMSDSCNPTSNSSIMYTDRLAAGCTTGCTNYENELSQSVWKLDVRSRTQNSANLKNVKKLKY